MAVWTPFSLATIPLGEEFARNLFLVYACTSASIFAVTFTLSFLVLRALLLFPLFPLTVSASSSAHLAQPSP